MHFRDFGFPKSRYVTAPEFCFFGFGFSKSRYVTAPVFFFFSKSRYVTAPEKIGLVFAPALQLPDCDEISLELHKLKYLAAAESLHDQ